LKAADGRLPLSVLLFVIPQGSAFVFAVAVTVVCSTPATNVISTEGGAFAAAVERSLYLALAITIFIPVMCM
jgi:hypothetical protein